MHYQLQKVCPCVVSKLFNSIHLQSLLGHRWNPNIGIFVVKKQTTLEIVHGFCEIPSGYD
jgi:hypothetical protein